MQILFLAYGLLLGYCLGNIKSDTEGFLFIIVTAASVLGTVAYMTQGFVVK